MNSLSKDLLFYSNYCLHSNNLINTISKTNLHNDIIYIFIDEKKVKIPSFEIANTSLLKFVSRSFNHIFVSTGTATFQEIQNALEILKGASFTLFHCVSTYPCLPAQINLSRMSYFKYMHSDVGFSDHTPGVEVSKIAVTLNSTYIEKHFTIDHGLPGRDNKFAILPSQLKELSDFIDIYSQVFLPLGLDFQESELETRNLYRGRFAA